MLSAQHLEITFNPGTPIETRALRGMSLDIPAGQFVTVIGSNGAGKSTFLNAISGDQTVDSGRIAIDGVDVTRMPVWARAERVARVFQDPMAGTCEDLTIEENMALAQRRGTFRNLGRAVKASMREGFRERLATLGLGLENRLTDRIGLLSGGQRHVLFDGEVFTGARHRVLEHACHALGAGPHGHACDVHAIDGDSAAVHRLVARNGVQKGGLAGPIGANDGDELPGRNVQRHAAQGAGFDRCAGVEGDFEVLGAQHGALSVRGFRTACAWRTCA